MSDDAIPLKILIVDDEPDVEALIQQGFRKEIRDGLYDMYFAVDGRGALDTLAKVPDIGLVVSDINMPRMDGLTLLRSIMQMNHPATTVMVTAYGDMANIRQAMNAGAFDFLTKPIDLSDLRATLDRAAAHVVHLNTIEAEKKDAQRIQSVLQRHFSPGVAAQLASQGDGLTGIGNGTQHEATFLFTDMQGFLRLMDCHPIEDMIALLNTYMDGIVSQVFAHSGTVMKIIGDSVYATFGAPISAPNHASLALDCALAIDDFTQGFRADCATRGINLGLTRIGIHSGHAVFGNTGSKHFFDFAAYGDPVNVASRLEQANKTLGTRICISGDSAAQIPAFRGRRVGTLDLRGKRDRITAYEPVTVAQMSDAQLTHYTKAVDMIDAQDAGAQTQLAQILIDTPDDPLTAFHLQRLLTGARDTDIRMG